MARRWWLLVPVFALAACSSDGTADGGFGGRSPLFSKGPSTLTTPPDRDLRAIDQIVAAGPKSMAGEPSRALLAEAAAHTKTTDMEALRSGVARLELEVVVLRQNLAADRPSLDRLIAIEGDVRSLLTELAVANSDADTAAAGRVMGPRAGAATALSDLAPPLDLLPPRADTAMAPQGLAPQGLSSQAIAPTAMADATSTSGQFAVHLASYRNIGTLERGWGVLAQANPDLLSNLTYRVGTLDKGRDGTFYRLKAGPLTDEATARTLCAAMQARRQYCVVREFSGAAPR